MSVFEIAQLAVDPAKAEEFDEAADVTLEPAASDEACRGVRVLRGVEDPNRYVLLVEWESVEAHQRFKESEGFPAFVQGLMQYLAEPPSAMHFEQR